MGLVIEGRERWRGMGKGKMSYFSLDRSFLLIYLSIHVGWFLYSEIMLVITFCKTVRKVGK